MQRILIVGPVGAGKTVLAEAVERRIGITRTELDRVRFDRNWQQLPESEFRARVSEIATAPQWIIDGNYASVRDVLWGTADTVVWLDYSLSLVLRRLFFRTLKRIIKREDLGEGRRETVRRLVSKGSILIWAIKSYWPLRTEYERACELYRSRTIIVQLRSPAETDRWLAMISQGTDTSPGFQRAPDQQL